MVPFLSSNMQNISMRFPYLLQNLGSNNWSEDVFSPQQKPIVNPIFEDCTISFVFWKFFLKSQQIFSISDRF